MYSYFFRYYVKGQGIYEKLFINVYKVSIMIITIIYKVSHKKCPLAIF